MPCKHWLEEINCSAILMWNKIYFKTRNIAEIKSIFQYYKRVNLSGGYSNPKYLFKSIVSNKRNKII